MTQQEHTNIIQQLAQLVTEENQATATELLTQLSDDYVEQLESVDSLTNTNNTLTANNEKLRAVNADLFLKVGTPTGKTGTGKEIENNNEIKGFDDLFNEKGELI